MLDDTGVAGETLPQDNTSQKTLVNSINSIRRMVSSFSPLQIYKGGGGAGHCDWSIKPHQSPSLSPLADANPFVCAVGVSLVLVVIANFKMSF